MDFFKESRRKRKRFDKQYQKGDWVNLKNVDELAHYSMIIGYFQYFKYGGSILDIGCGEGILLERLGINSYSYYIGIDFSSDAIEQACKKSLYKAEFINADVNSYSTDKHFDTIIFNESLYYLKNPLDNLKRYEDYLEKDGIFIISMFDKRKNSLWDKIESAYNILDETRVINRAEKPWVIKVLSSRSDASTLSSKSFTEPTCY